MRGPLLSFATPLQRACRLTLQRQTIAMSNRKYASTTHIPHRTASEIRQLFLSFFSQRNHRILPSASLVPQRDPSLLFTSAGMVPLKEFFLGQLEPPHPYLTSSQLCLRVGGKHNDLDNVGRTARHHTLFEMLGNFSFAGDKDYKQRAISLAWEFITKELKIPSNRLRVSVFEGSRADAEIWKTTIGLSDEQIVFRGAEDNYWQMGDVGPCGPCTEIFYDQGHEVDGDRWLEIWNLVFMEHFKDVDGKTNMLARPCIDTGMGLERVAAVVQGVPSNFDIDSFQSIIRGIQAFASERNGKKIIYDSQGTDNETVTLKVLADHLRAISCLIVEGVLPSNIGRGYVLRRLIRRSLTFGWTIGLHDPFLADMVQVLFSGSDFDGSSWAVHHLVYQEREFVKKIIRNEEATFYRTLSNGMKILEEAMVKATETGSIDAETGFRLYDTYGFPVDMAAILAERKGLHLDVAKVEALMQKQRQESRKNWKGSDIFDGKGSAQTDTDLKQIFKGWQQQGVSTSFSGYDSIYQRDAKIAALQRINATDFAIAIDPCPFYAISGGQISDKGFVRADGIEFEVVDVIKPYSGAIACIVRSSVQGQCALDNAVVGDKVQAQVESRSREEISAHHTATHLLHAALRHVLGNDVRQCGSVVEHDRLRFDFSYGAALTRQQLNDIENYVNQVCRNGASVQTIETSYDDAVSGPLKAIGLFGEKYEDQVRVVRIGDVSSELCGGTHVENTMSIIPFKIVEETSIATGTRRIQAMVARAAQSHLDRQAEVVAKCASVLGTSSAKVAEQVEATAQKVRDLEKECQALKKRLIEYEIAEKTNIKSFNVKGLNFELHALPNLEGDDKDLIASVRDHAEKYLQVL
eukprot:TRINITY_DN4599_c0_g1_i9.p1 TRINITY_DN4599_c0_g1~~TRINITY_DN4599_c0_g1_i9.p1  ORF type:complete len:863 (+),score=171.77 TRINITY_DN4599_c0_g1_i9:49-2637(+)